MQQPFKPLEHQDADHKDDDVLRQEAKSYLGVAAPFQLVAELLTKLRTLDLGWWAPDKLRSKWPAQDRLRWFRARADLRQSITSQLTGLAKRAARKKSPDFQASLIDSVVDEGDITASIFEDAFDPADMVTYGPADAFWRAFLDMMPWDQDSSVLQELVAWLLEALLADKSSLEGGSFTRKPILTALDVRSSIDTRVWIAKVPVDVRVAIEDARMMRERDRPQDPFLSADELKIATPAVLAQNFPLRELLSVLATAERKMGFSSSPRTSGPDTSATPRARTDASAEAKPASASASPQTSTPRASAATPNVVTPSAPPAAASSVPVAAPAPAAASTPPPAATPAPTSARPPAHEVAGKSAAPPPASGRPAVSPSVIPPSARPPAMPEPTPMTRPLNADAIKPAKRDAKADPARGAAASGARPPSSLSTIFDGIEQLAGDDLENTNPWVTDAATDDIADPITNDTEVARRRRTGKP